MLTEIYQEHQQWNCSTRPHHKNTIIQMFT